jgi:hypothetical protein
MIQRYDQNVCTFTFLGVKGARSLMEVDTLLQMFYGKN